MHTFQVIWLGVPTYAGAYMEEGMVVASCDTREDALKAIAEALIEYADAAEDLSFTIREVWS